MKPACKPWTYTSSKFRVTSDRAKKQIEDLFVSIQAYLSFITCMYGQRFQSITLPCFNHTFNPVSKMDTSVILFAAAVISVHNLTLWNKNSTLLRDFFPSYLAFGNYQLQSSVCLLKWYLGWIFWSRFVRTGDFSVDITNFSNHLIFTI